MSFRNGDVRSVSSIRGRVVKALRSGRSQHCWRGFESHRMHFYFPRFAYLIRTRGSSSNGRAHGSHPWGTGIDTLVLHFLACFTNVADLDGLGGVPDLPDSTVLAHLAGIAGNNGAADRAGLADLARWTGRNGSVSLSGLASLTCLARIPSLLRLGEVVGLDNLNNLTCLTGFRWLTWLRSLKGCMWLI